MRAVLIVIAIAFAAIVISVLLQPRKELHPNPQEIQAQKADEEMARNMRLAQEQERERTARDFNPPRENVQTYTMTVAGRGDVTFELYPKAAPATVAHITRLIKSGFYNGIRVHRVEPGFVVQFGDPQSKTLPIDDPRLGSAGSGENVRFETNSLPHVRSSISLALSAPRSDTGDSQLFINLDNNAPLNGDYVVFGKVTRGMEVVEKIRKGDVIERITAA